MVVSAIPDIFWSSTFSMKEASSRSSPAQKWRRPARKWRKEDSTGKEKTKKKGGEAQEADQATLAATRPQGPRCVGASSRGGAVPVPVALPWHGLAPTTPQKLASSTNKREGEKVAKVEPGQCDELIRLLPQRLYLRGSCSQGGVVVACPSGCKSSALPLALHRGQEGRGGPEPGKRRQGPRPKAKENQRGPQPGPEEGGGAQNRRQEGEGGPEPRLKKAEGRAQRPRQEIRGPRTKASKKSREPRTRQKSRGPRTRSKKAEGAQNRARRLAGPRNQARRQGLGPGQKAEGSRTRARRQGPRQGRNQRTPQQGQEDKGAQNQNLRRQEGPQNQAKEGMEDPNQGKKAEDLQNRKDGSEQIKGRGPKPRQAEPGQGQRNRIRGKRQGTRIRAGKSRVPWTRSRNGRSGLKPGKQAGTPTRARGRGPEPGRRQRTPLRI